MGTHSNILLAQLWLGWALSLICWGADVEKSVYSVWLAGEGQWYSGALCMSFFKRTQGGSLLVYRHNSNQLVLLVASLVIWQGTGKRAPGGNTLTVCNDMDKRNLEKIRTFKQTLNKNCQKGHIHGLHINRFQAFTTTSNLYILRLCFIICICKRLHLINKNIKKLCWEGILKYNPPSHHSFIQETFPVFLLCYRHCLGVQS